VGHPQSGGGGGRTIFSNVPTATGGVISGNISTGPGSPFGAGGKYEAQVSNIKATIAKAPKGFYDPVGWDDFLKKSEKLGLEPTRADDSEIMEELLKISPARDAMIGLNQMGLGAGGRIWDSCPRCSQAQTNELAKKRDNYYDIIAFNVNQLMMEKNAPLIQAIEQQERQLEIDQAVKIALEQKIRETATPTPEPKPEPTPASTISILPIIIIAVALIGILLFLRRRA